jgi:tetratricopeptide (TPR) repeat protein
VPRSMSVTMIVKDESEQLAECLSGISGLGDEICIVDTGSQDNTVEIARQHHAKVTFFIWCDDFSAARNESLRCCSSDWIFVLDADERLAPEDLPRIRALTDGPLNRCYRFVTRNYTNCASVSEFHRCEPTDAYARGFAGWYPSEKVRLFPNKIGARFEGKVHELVHRSLEGLGVQAAPCDVPIHHYPYTKSPARILEKRELYAHLGRQKVEANPSDPAAYVELGNQYAEMQDYLHAAAAYRDALKRDPSNAVVLKDLGGVLHLLRRSEDAKQALRLALELNPSLSDAWRNLGVIYAGENEWAASAECFEQATLLDPTWDDGYRYLSVALEGAGNFRDASKAARKALEANPNSSEALQLYLHQMLRLEQRTEARDVLEGLIRSGAERPEFHNAIGELYYYDEQFEKAKLHFVAAGQGGIASAFNNLGVVLYRQQRFAEAKEAFEQCLAADPGHRGARANLQKAVTHLNGETQ